MDQRTNQVLQRKTARETVKIRRANNGYVINTDEGMTVAANLEEVKAFLDKKFKETIDTKPA